MLDHPISCNEKEDTERNLASAKHECERLQAIVNEVKCARDCAVASLKLKDEEMNMITTQKVENSSKMCVHLTIFLTFVIVEMLLVPKPTQNISPFSHLSSLGSNI